MQVAMPAHDLIAEALGANKAHQYTLSSLAERLQLAIEEADKLLDDVVDLSEDEGEGEQEIRVDGAKRPSGLFTASEFLHPESPFYEEALQRTRYVNQTNAHQMKTRELEILTDAVRLENIRIQAQHDQQRGRNATNTQNYDPREGARHLNWVSIAEKVSSAAGAERTPDDCRVKWLGDQQPSINHGEWTTEELEKLSSLVTSQGNVHDWVDIARQLGTNRTPMDCMRRGLQRAKHTWNSTTDQRLAEAVQMYGMNNWNLVARYVSEDATAAQCQGRYTRSLNPDIKLGSWSAEEDNRLRLAVKAYENSWVNIAACVPGRTNDQCRERWLDQLSVPNTKNQWTEEEDRLLLEAVDSFGNQWKRIASNLGNGKTGPVCRMRFNKLQKQKSKTPVDSLGSLVAPSPERPSDLEEATNQTGREQRAEVELRPIELALEAETDGNIPGPASEPMTQKRIFDNCPTIAPIHPVKRRRQKHDVQEPLPTSTGAVSGATPAISNKRPRPRPRRKDVDTSPAQNTDDPPSSAQEPQDAVAGPPPAPVTPRRPGAHQHSNTQQRQSARLAAKNKWFRP